MWQGRRIEIGIQGQHPSCLDLIVRGGKSTGFRCQSDTGPNRIQVDVQSAEENRQFIQQGFELIAGFPEGPARAIDQVEVPGGVEIEGLHEATDARQILPDFGDFLFVLGELFRILFGGFIRGFVFGIRVGLTIAGMDDQVPAGDFFIAHSFDQIGSISEFEMGVVVHEGDAEDVDGVGRGEVLQAF